jgi:hypothetical protein
MKEIRSESIAGWCFVASMVALVTSIVVAPSGVYQGSVSERLEIIDANQGQWVLTKVVDATTLALVGVGGLALTINRRSVSRLRGIGGTLLMVAGIAGVVWFFLLAVSPGRLFEGQVPVVTILVMLIAAGLVGLGADFLRSGYPRWAGLTGVLLGGGVLVGGILVQILRLGSALAVAFEVLVLLGVLVIGIMLVRRGRSSTVVSDAPGH